jgi:hypothetical protein
MIPQDALARRFRLKLATAILALALIAAILIVWRYGWSISRKSGHRFSAGNATSVTNLEHDPIRQKRGML